MSASNCKPSVKLVIAALICGLLLCNGVDDFFFYLNNNTAMFLLLLAAVLQWWLLRSEWAEVSVWLPVVLSTLCALLGEFIGIGKFHTDCFLLTGFAVPVYFGATAVLVITALLRLIRRSA